jgi:16S rRNA (uracil1498-N3)-methyltransferase
MPATPAWPPKSTPRLFVDGLLAAGQQRQLDGAAAHYLGTVMRRAPGDPVLLCDNVTGEWLARVIETAKRHLTLVVEQHLRPREPVPDVWLCASPLRKPHFDMVLEKATELGVARIMPVIMQRSVADKINMERARTIITEAAEQCARTALPEVAPVQTLKALLAAMPAERTLFFADEDGGLPALATMAANPGPAALLIGPEGGFAEQERAAICALPGAVAITLGPRILRAETAAIAAIALWVAATDGRAGALA